MEGSRSPLAACIAWAPGAQRARPQRQPRLLHAFHQPPTFSPPPPSLWLSGPTKHARLPHLPPTVHAFHQPTTLPLNAWQGGSTKHACLQYLPPTLRAVVSLSLSPLACGTVAGRRPASATRPSSTRSSTGGAEGDRHSACRPGARQPLDMPGEGRLNGLRGARSGGKQVGLRATASQPAAAHSRQSNTSQTNSQEHANPTHPPQHAHLRTVQPGARRRCRRCHPGKPGDTSKGGRVGSQQPLQLRQRQLAPTATRRAGR